MASQPVAAHYAVANAMQLEALPVLFHMAALGPLRDDFGEAIGSCMTLEGPPGCGKMDMVLMFAHGVTMRPNECHFVAVASNTVQQLDQLVTGGWNLDRRLRVAYLVNRTKTCTFPPARQAATTIDGGLDHAVLARECKERCDTKAPPAAWCTHKSNAYLAAHLADDHTSLPRVLDFDGIFKNISAKEACGFFAGGVLAQSVVAGGAQRGLYIPCTHAVAADVNILGQRLQTQLPTADTFLALAGRARTPRDPRVPQVTVVWDEAHHLHTAVQDAHSSEEATPAALLAASISLHQALQTLPCRIPLKYRGNVQHLAALLEELHGGIQAAVDALCEGRVHHQPRRCHVRPGCEVCNDGEVVLHPRQLFRDPAGGAFHVFQHTAGQVLGRAAAAVACFDQQLPDDTEREVSALLRRSGAAELQRLVEHVHGYALACVAAPAGLLGADHSVVLRFDVVRSEDQSTLHDVSTASVTLTCDNAQPHISAMQRSVSSLVLMSGTMYPKSFMTKHLGLQVDHAVGRDYWAGIVQPRNLLVVACPTWFRLEDVRFTREQLEDHDRRHDLAGQFLDRLLALAAVLPAGKGMGVFLSSAKKIEAVKKLWVDIGRYGELMGSATVLWQDATVEDITAAVASQQRVIWFAQYRSKKSEGWNPLQGEAFFLVCCSLAWLSIGSAFFKRMYKTLLHVDHPQYTDAQVTEAVSSARRGGYGLKGSMQTYYNWEAIWPVSQTLGRGMRGVGTRGFALLLGADLVKAKQQLPTHISSRVQELEEAGTQQLSAAVQQWLALP